MSRLAVDGVELRIAIVDDHPIFRAGLRSLLLSEPGIRVVAEGESAAGVTELVRNARPDLMFLDYSMPDGGALEALRQLRDGGLKIRTVVLTAGIDRDQIREALLLGARGVLLKTAATELLFRCIPAVLAGQYWVDRETTADLVDTLRAQADRSPSQLEATLSPTERRVLLALARGASNKVIARELGIAEQTVKNHLSRLFERLEVTSRLELVVEARRLGLISAE